MSERRAKGRKLPEQQLCEEVLSQSLKVEKRQHRLPMLPLGVLLQLHRQWCLLKGL
ncbi:hypothetical protein [Cesiribacter sp. SM1]|uniref:hypothetical protein n=1 Tax=Cesiribacter sp. SM1 TaxID=2861196 RepID=UPI001CD33FE1|nr:hypothetical protein [Cesiribacter sp. SM1]